MSLVKYKQKRKFNETPEPAGKTQKAEDKLIFVVQRHHASHLHYDFRLELNGTLKSWAVPKGPSLNPKDKRLAMMVEDHPIEYAKFEGDIPAGNYGAGHVDIWDKGTYEPIDEKGNVITTKEFSRYLKEGSIKFRLKGRKLKGEFALVNLKKDEKSWLLIKHRDKHATDEDYNSEDYAKKSSVAYTAARNSKRKALVKKPTVKKKAPQEEIEPTKSFRLKFRSKTYKYKNYISPMLAKLHNKAFNSPEWIYEIKWDGYRAIAEAKGKDIKLYSRKGLSFSEEYEVVFEELKKIKKKVVLDGEVVALNDKGVPSFQLLQQYGQNPDVPLVYYVFDILYLDGKSLKDKSLIERKKILKNILPKSDLIKYCDHIEEKGIEFFAAMQKQGLEGMIAKRIDSTYHEGKRSSDWLKVKHMLTDEAVIAGYTQPRGSRKYFGALILGSNEKGGLKYIGHTGTGFDQKTLKDVYQKLQPLVTDKNPFKGKVRVNAPVTWVKPVLVCNLKYTEVTDEGARRHPVFMGLRKDKDAHEVKSEAPVTIDKKEPVKQTTIMDKERTIAGKKLKLTNLDKVFWPEEGYTKGDVIEYYNKVYKYIIKHIKNRPQSLRRHPNGITGADFFQKDAGGQAPDWMTKWINRSESVNKDVNWLVCNDKPSLLYLANLGCIELNPWNSRIENPGKPDYMIMDLDPSDKNTFDEVIECAHVIKEILDRGGCDCYCKTSGATGLHIYVPLGAKYDYEQARMFSEIIANLTVEQLPDTTTTERSLKKRKRNHIYVDYLQNKEGATLSCAYSLRPKPGAPVSTPLEWKELKPGLKPEDFNINNIIKRLEKKKDLFAPVLGKGIDMMKVLKKIE